MQKDTVKYIESNMALLESAAASSPDEASAARQQLQAVHHLVCGQDVLITVQLWMDSPGRIGSKQPCATATTLQPSAPVFQVVAGKAYTLTFLVQNRDLAASKRLPFTDVIEVSPCCTCLRVVLCAGATQSYVCLWPGLGFLSPVAAAR